MSVVSLDPALTDVVIFVGARERLLGVSHTCSVPDDVPASVLTSSKAPAAGATSDLATLFAELLPFRVDVERLVALAPRLVLLGGNAAKYPSRVEALEELLKEQTKEPVRVRAFQPSTLESMYTAFEEIGELLGKKREGVELIHRVKTQLMDWGDSFYDRSKNRKVTVLSSINPFRVAGRWVPELVRCMSGHPQHFAAGEGDLETDLGELERFRTEVIVIAPEGYTLEESVRTLKYIEKFPEWENIPAVKRGDVVFADGITLYRPGPKILHGAGIVASAMAGLPSGYITAKDSFFQLRYLELHRHTFFK